MMLRLAGLVVALLLASNAFAQTLLFDFHSSNTVPIPDNAFDGSLGTMATDTITLDVPATVGAPGTVASLELGVRIDHPWVGDLTILLVSPSGARLMVMNRPGFPAVSFGDGSDFSASFPVTFSDAAVSSAELVGATCASSEIVGDLGCTESVFAPAPEGGPADFSLSDFVGADIGAPELNGLWTIAVGDSGFQDLGSLRGWSLHFEIDVGSTGGANPSPGATVPAPATLALLGLGLIGYGARRRR